MLILPGDIYNKIITYLNYDVRTLCNFAFTSKAAGNIFRQMAQSNGDINLVGERVQFCCDDKTRIKACIFQILKLHVLEIHPELLNTLSGAIDGVKYEGTDPNDINNLYDHVLRYAGGIKTLPSVRNFMKAAIPFDFQTKKIENPEGIATALSDAIFEKKTVLAQLIFGHSGSKGIKDENLGQVLVAAANMDNYELTQMTRSHPNANTCPVLDVSVALTNAAVNNNYKMTKVVLSFQSAANIPGDFLYSDPENTSHALIRSLFAAISNKNPKIIRKIISHPNAKNMDLVMPYDGRIPSLQKACETKDRRVIAAVLSYPKFIEVYRPYINLGTALISYVDIQLYKAGTVLIGNEDLRPIHKVNRILEESKPNQQKLRDLSEAFVCLSYELQYFLYLMLCKTHGCPSGNIEKEGMVHLIKHPHSLLPIMKKLTST